jgi:hypothetical protein
VVSFVDDGLHSNAWANTATIRQIALEKRVRLNPSGAAMGRCEKMTPVVTVEAASYA